MFGSGVGAPSTTMLLSPSLDSTMILLLIDSMILCQSPWMLLDVDSEFSMVKTMGTRLPKMDHVDVNCLKLIVFPWQLWVAKSLLDENGIEIYPTTRHFFLDCNKSSL